MAEIFDMLPAGRVILHDSVRRALMIGFLVVALASIVLIVATNGGLV